jgi:hypothetical protein
MRTEHGEIWYFNDSRFIQLRSIYIKREEKGRELNGREKERERGERCGCGSNYGDGVGL